MTGKMQLRDYPLMRLRDFCHWPPPWVRIGTVPCTAPKVVTGEIGVLRAVRYYPERRGRIYLTVDYDDAAYVGCVMIHNEAFGEEMFQHLRRCCSMSLDDIGNSPVGAASWDPLT
jgi:hypothetical protein